MADASARQENEFHRIASIMGGTHTLKRRIDSRLDAHDAIVHGLPSDALAHLVQNVQILHKADVLQKAVGVSVRTVQRRRDAPAKALSSEQSGRAWKFAEILSKATELLGNQEAAENWLVTPAIGLEQRRPVDLLATPAGIKLVEDLLVRMDYGVYA